MTYFVRQMDPRFLITMSVDGAHLEGEIKAFYYQPPVVQPSMIDLKNVVVSREFTGHKMGAVVVKTGCRRRWRSHTFTTKGSKRLRLLFLFSATCVAIDVTNPNLTLDAFGTVMSDITCFILLHLKSVAPGREILM